MEILKNYFFIQNQFGQIIIYSISLLFIVGLYNWFIYFWRYRISEIRALARLGAKVSDLNDNNNIPEIREAILTGLPARSIVASRIISIFNIIEKNHVVDHEQLAAITYDKENSRLGLILISYISRTLILLGLMGTFIGLASIAFEFKALLEDINTSSVNVLIESMQHATREIGKTTEGLTTAFTTTLWGLTGTLLLSFFTLFLQHAQEVFLARLEDITAIKLLPLFNPPHITQALADSKRQLAESTNIIQQSIEGLKKSASETFSSIDKMESLTHKLDATADVFYAGATMMSKTNVDFASTIGDLSGNLIASTDRDQKLFSDLGKIINQISDQHRLIDNMVSLVQRNEMSNENVVQDCFTQIFEGQKKHIEQIDLERLEYRKTIQKSINNQNKLFDLFLNSSTSQNKQILETVKELNKEQSQLVEQIHQSKVDSNHQFNDMNNRHQQIIAELHRSIRPNWNSYTSETEGITRFSNRHNQSFWVRIKIAFANLFRD